MIAPVRDAQGWAEGDTQIFKHMWAAVNQYWVLTAQGLGLLFSILELELVDGWTSKERGRNIY